MTGPRENWYIYYPAPAAADALPRLRAMQRQLAQASGIVARIEARAAADATPTWMEVYEGVADPQAFAAQLADALQASGLQGELPSQRHVERFRPL